MAETISQNLVDRPVTQLRICPLTLTPLAPSAVTKVDSAGQPLPVEQEIRYTNCIGSACMLWQFEVGTDPRAGDCAYNIAAQAASLSAHLMNRMFAAAGGQAQPEQPTN